ncbi:MAG: GIY-YIG nuclease family protein [Ferruginibacter sp.]
MNVYGLRNPIDDNYFYVGVSGDLKRRLLGHMSSTDKNKDKATIIKKIVDAGLRPEIKLLQYIPDNNIGSISEIELFWINKLLHQGHPITNKSLNGAGAKPSVNPKMAITIYVTNSKVLAFGGIEKIKEILYNFINEQTSNKIAERCNNQIAGTYGSTSRSAESHKK